MSSQPAPSPALADAPPLGLMAKLRALRELGKPNLSLLVVVTAVFGFFVATSNEQAVDPLSWLHAAMLVIGTGLTAMGACAANMCSEHELDALMHRTRGRPLPSGRVTEEEAFAFAIGSFLVGFSLLYAFCGPIPAVLSLATTAIYAFVYTPSKRHGPISVWIGAIPGAIPPLMGWTTVTGRIDLGGMALFALLFTWQFPHFLALAYMYREDYARGGFRFLSKHDTEQRTGRAIGIGAVATVLASLAPWWLGLTSLTYFVIASLAGAHLLRASFGAARDLTAKTARRAFFSTIIYLPVLLLATVLDRLVH